MLTRESILSLVDTPLAPVPVPTAHGTVYVPRMTAREMVAYLDVIGTGRKGVELSYLLVDRHGTRQFTEADAATLERLPASLVMPVTRAFNEANGLTGPKDSAPAGGSPTA